MENQENRKSKNFIIFAPIMVIVALIVSLLICSVMGDRGDMGFRVEYAKCDTVYAKPDTVYLDTLNMSKSKHFIHEEINVNCESNERYFYVFYKDDYSEGGESFSTIGFFQYDSVYSVIKKLHKNVNNPAITYIYEFRDKSDFDNFRK